MKKKCHYWRAVILSTIISLSFLSYSCVSGSKTEEEFLTEADFNKMNKIDIHCHVNKERPDFMEQAVEDNFRILTINTNSSLGSIEDQQEWALFQRKAFPNRIAYLTTFSMEGWDNDDWHDKTMAYLEESFKNGAIGIKVWKNIGMVEKDKNGEFIMIDDPKFDAVFDYLEEKGIPVAGHLGEPLNCWLPLDEMTVNNDRSYFENYPQYHMYLHPEYPSYEDQIAARDRRLEKHPRMKFMGAHLGSLEWSVDEMSKFFEQFPNATLEMAARLCHLQVQTQADYQKVRDFFIKYQDRIIYGTDLGDYTASDEDPEKLKRKTHEQWKSDWKYLTTNEEMSSQKVNGEFKGLKLPRKVVEKIYYLNAENQFPELKELKI